ncbi:hypothetical protein SAMN04489761_4514 [Tenacibaculum sp. MAR_2009_124]|nr:hypothetical protein SAMN04489761_4514 [Tenacibaculum sp. MAR_2009_124]
MENDIWWHLAWKDEEYFEFGEGHYPTNKHIVLDKIKTWDATERWIHVSNQPIIDFKIMYIDSTGYIPSRVKLTFSNKKSTSILIAEELDLGKKTITNIEFKMSGVIFVIHNEKILR